MDTIVNIKQKALLEYLIYILKLSFNKYKGLYLLYVANIVSILIEFSALLIISAFSQEVIDLPISYFNELTKEGLLLILVILFLLRFSSMFVLESRIVYYAKEIQVYLSSTALKKIMYENIKDIEKIEIGHYTTLAGDESSNASQILISMTGILNNTLLVIVYLFSIYIFSVDMFILLIILLIIITIFTKVIYKKIFLLGHDQALFRRKSSSVFMDSLNSLRIVKSFSLESFMSREYKDLVYKYFSINSRLIIYPLLTKYFPLVAMLIFFSIFIVLNNKDMNTATIFALLFMTMRLLHAIGTLASMIGKLIGELKGVSNIVEFIKGNYINEKDEEIDQKVNSVIIDNIVFSYDNNKVFDKLNFSFFAGKSYAIYGESGSGKSTLLDLIMDFITPDSGNVLINGVKVTEINERSLTKHVMYVGQESLVFNKSIRENIELNKSFLEKDLMDVLKIVKMHDMVLKLKNGLDYKLFYKGTNISGGQRQRINLARALIRKPDVLILDEATSALDEQTKKFIVDNIIEEYKDKIVIFVTHDQSILPSVTNVMNLKDIKDKKC
jgi:ABC-type bacteriocin/lantibiotic exporter with double-glycine peptidase domain